MDETIYQILFWIVPSLFIIIGWFLIRTLQQIADQLKGLDKSVNDLRVTVQEVLTKHDGLEDRVEKLEEKIFI
jgi:uncharacterized protein YoxC